ncbi:CDK5 regulatory subunit associated protein 1, partial [Parelaphostrongylus tenuis]
METDLSHKFSCRVLPGSMSRDLATIAKSIAFGNWRRFSCQVATATARSEKQQRTIPKDGLDISHFINRTQRATPDDICGHGRKVKYITYGCQMNVNDMEVVRALLMDSDYLETDDIKSADIVLLNTCSIREGAEEKVWRELKRIRSVATKMPTIGVLGCMAERVRHDLLSKNGLVDVVAGPDAYRDLPRLLAVARAGSALSTSSYPSMKRMLMLDLSESTRTRKQLL